MKSQLKVFGSLLIVAILTLVVFQNCSNVKFSGKELANTSSGTPVTPGTPTTSGTPIPPVVDTPAPPVICDPFSTGSTCAAGEGLKGSLYYLASNDTNSPRAKIADIIDFGLKATSQVVLSQLNIPTRNWTDGFPGSDGTPIKNTDGQPLNEWFALDLAGTIRVNSELAKSSDDYQFAQFALMTDDGSILEIDGTTVINHDNQHSPLWKCAAAAVNLKSGDLHQIRVRYFQGPRNQIALQLMWRPWSQHASSCDEKGGFTAVPKTVLFN